MKITLLCFACVAGIAAGADGQEPVRLTLGEAVRTALAQNPDVQSANLALAEARDDQRIARSALFPQASLVASGTEQRFNLETVVGFRLPNRPQHTGPFSAYQAGPVVTLPLLDLTLWRRYRTAADKVSASTHDERSTREETTLLIVSHYLGARRAAARVGAASSRVSLAEALLAQARDLQRTGVTTKVDSLRADVRLQEERQALLVAQTESKTSLYTLARLLGIDPQRPLVLADAGSFFDVADSEALAIPSLSEAYEQRPELQAAEAREQTAREERRAVAAEALPRISALGRWAYQGVTADDMIPSYRFEVGVEWPLFTGGRLAAERQRSSLELQRRQVEVSDTRKRIAEQLKTSLDEMASARAEVDVANEALHLATEEVELARGRFAAGVADNVAVVAAQDALARANDNRIDALYRFNLARASVARASGHIEEMFARSR
jgi:outer membrane protein